MMHGITDPRAEYIALLIAASLLALGIYVLPALLAWTLCSPQRASITLLNLFLGWTLLLWLVALIWAISTGNGGHFDDDRTAHQKRGLR